MNCLLCNLLPEYCKIDSTYDRLRKRFVCEAQRHAESGIYLKKSRGRKKVIEANTTIDKIHAAFDAISQRRTRPRRLIEERVIELAKSGANFTIDDLWQGIREAEPRLGRATVYRAVETLVNLGLLNRVDFADGTHHYRVCDDGHHHHLTCTQCHRVVEVDVCLPNELLAAVGDQTDFAIEGHSLSLFGRCPACRNKQG